jgi:crotonobetainyl-CoA:carnitine CoA-transferase CaiB-like acyl-CoA transferase
MGGIMDLTGDPAGEPQKIGVAFADVFTGVYGVVGIQAALRRREMTGQGGHVDMALFDVQLAVLANQAMNYLASGKTPKRMGNAHPNIVPYQVFPVSDGHIIIACGNDGQFAKLCNVLGVSAFASHPDYVTNKDRVHNRDTLCALIGGLTKAHSRDGLLAALEAVGVPAGPINSVADALADPQAVARGMVVELEAPETRAGKIRSVRSPIVIDGEPMVAHQASPALG